MKLSGSDAPAATRIRRTNNQNICCAFERFCLVVTDAVAQGSKTGFVYFDVEQEVEYVGFDRDFGPFNLASVHTFCEIVDRMRKQHPTEVLALQCKPDPCSLTNTVFLVGSYMIMKRSNDVSDVLTALGPILSKVVPYRDVSPGPQNFNLHVEDCWRGLFRAKSLTWVDFSPGGFDATEYAILDNPLNADLHEIVPGKLVAMRGPKGLPDGQLWIDVTHDLISFLQQ